MSQDNNTERNITKPIIAKLDLGKTQHQKQIYNLAEWTPRESSKLTFFEAPEAPQFRTGADTTPVK